MKKLIVALVILVVLAGGAVLGLYLFNRGLQANMTDVIDGDPRNSGVEVAVHYGDYYKTSILVYDMKSVDGEKSPADVFRVFLQFAAQVKDDTFDHVEFCFRGDHKFTLDGDDFETIGDEFGTQNPMYTIRTFPEKLKTPEGSKAYPTWEGGALGVLGKQMKDYNDFHRKWYIEEMAH